jgi:hypothetical protein
MSSFRAYGIASSTERDERPRALATGGCIRPFPTFRITHKAMNARTAIPRQPRRSLGLLSHPRSAGTCHPFAVKTRRCRSLFES